MKVRRLGKAFFLTQALAFMAPVGLAADEWPERLEGHGGPVKSVAMSADGSRLLSTSFDYSAVLWIRPDGEQPLGSLRLLGHNAAVNDGRFVGADRAVTVSDDSDLILWDLITGAELHRFKGGGEKVLGVATSEDGRYAALASWDNSARLYDLAAQPPLQIATLKGHRGNVNAVAFSPDGDHVFTASYDGGIRKFDLATGGLVRELANIGWGVNVLKVLQDGDQILFGATDGTLGVLDTLTGAEVKVLPPHTRPILALAVSGNLERIASGGGDGLIRVYDAATFELLEEFQNPYGPVWGLAFTPDGEHLFYTGLDDQIHKWQVSPRKPFEPLDVDFPRRFQVSETTDPGELQFARKCSVCHSLTPDDANRAGPTLFGVFGRVAGTLPGYPYSEALRTAGFTWNEKTISDLFDHGPDVVTPGSKMPIQRLKTVEDRNALVAYLKRATDPAADGNKKETIQ